MTIDNNALYFQREAVRYWRHWLITRKTVKILRNQNRQLRKTLTYLLGKDTQSRN